ncbi:MAG: amidohydrolase family protein [Phycisphaerae bacterium]
MFIDVHVHLGRLLRDDPGLRPADLLRWMDRHEVEQALVLPIENPEETYFYVTTEQVIRWCRPHRDRLLPYANIDPRRGTRRAGDFGQILGDYAERGCVGFGEMLAVLPINDGRLKQIYEVCGELGWPVMLHIGSYGGIDRPGLPLLDEICREFPRTRFIGHAQYFWSEISGRVNRRTRGGYPAGPVAPGGRLDILLGRHGNLYADISARSGYNALARDRQFARGFLERHARQVLFGSDYLRRGQSTPQFQLLSGLDLRPGVKRAIARDNARRLFGLG